MADATNSAPGATPNSGSQAPANGQNTGGVPGGGVQPTTVSTAPAQINVSPSQPTAQPATGWTDGMSDELKGYIQTKGFQTAGDIADSYRNLEKLQGVPKERMLKLPENIDISTPEGRAVFERLGAPKEAKDYNFADIKDDAARKWTQDTMHELGITKAQAEQLAAKYGQREAKMMEDARIAQASQAQQAEANLKNAWGNAYEQNQNRVLQTAKLLGMDDAQLGALRQVLGPQKATETLFNLSKATAESTFHGGNAGTDIMSADMAKAQISALSKDQGFIKALNAGDTTAKQKWTDLHKAAYTGTMNI